MNCIFTTTLAALLALSLPPSSLAKQRKHRPGKVTSSKPALAVINNPAPAYLSGEVNVTVRGDENPILRLQMVPSGQSLVEFPAKDRIFKVNPADPDLVTIEDSPTKESDRYILLRSSKQFLPPPSGAGGSSAATSLLVQMTSGMVVTLLIYPAREFSQVVHRCVVRYDRDAIIKARQTAGLAVNLDQRSEESVIKLPASLQIAPLPKAVAERALSSTAPLQSLPTTEKAAPSVPAAAAETPHTARTTADSLLSMPKPTLRADEIKNSKDSKSSPAVWSEKLKWGKPLHGLKVASQTRVISATEHQALLLVQNIFSIPINLAPALPELFKQTLDERGRVLQTEPVRPVMVETSTTNGLIAPGATARFIVTYATPVLGAKQRLCVAVAQSSAADEPVVVELSKGTR